MEVRMVTCPVCGNHYSQSDYSSCPRCAKSTNPQGERGNLAGWKYGTIGTETLPAHSSQVLRQQGGKETMTDRENKTIGMETQPLDRMKTAQERRTGTQDAYGNTTPADADRGGGTSPSYDDFVNPKPYGDAVFDGRTRPPYPNPNPGPNPDVTLPVVKSVRPVLGWLIAMNGKHKGDAYEIRESLVTIGRDSSENDIVLDDETKTVSRKPNCVLRYFDNIRKFRIILDRAANPVFIGKNRLYDQAELNAYDLIQIGNVKLLFLPLCCDRFDWSEEA